MINSALNRTKNLSLEGETNCIKTILLSEIWELEEKNEVDLMVFPDVVSPGDLYPLMSHNWTLWR